MSFDFSLFLVSSCLLTLSSLILLSSLSLFLSRCSFLFSSLDDNALPGVATLVTVCTVAPLSSPHSHHLSPSPLPSPHLPSPSHPHRINLQNDRLSPSPTPPPPTPCHTCKITPYRVRSLSIARRLLGHGPLSDETRCIIWALFHVAHSRSVADSLGRTDGQCVCARWTGEAAEDRACDGRCIHTVCGMGSDDIGELKHRPDAYCR